MLARIRRKRRRDRATEETGKLVRVVLVIGSSSAQVFLKQSSGERQKEI